MAPAAHDEASLLQAATEFCRIARLPIPDLNPPMSVTDVATDPGALVTSGKPL
jgi:hypothetical protein